MKYYARPQGLEEGFAVQLLGTRPDAADVRLGYHEAALQQSWRSIPPAKLAEAEARCPLYSLSTGFLVRVLF